MKERAPDSYPPSAEESFLSRWSMRKQAAREEQQTQQSEQPPAESQEAQPEQLTDQDMPPLEGLNENSDYTGFLSPKVSDELRRLALRKLFHAADFNHCDGLDDYADDFTNFEKLGDIITSDMRFQMEQQARKLAQSEPLEEETAGQDEKAIAAEDEPAGMDDLEAQEVQASAGIDNSTHPELETKENGSESDV